MHNFAYPDPIVGFILDDLVEFLDMSNVKYDTRLNIILLPGCVIHLIDEIISIHYLVGESTSFSYAYKTLPLKTWHIGDYGYRKKIKKFIIDARICPRKSKTHIL